MPTSNANPERDVEVAKRALRLAGVELASPGVLQFALDVLARSSGGAPPSEQTVGDLVGARATTPTALVASEPALRQMPIEQHVTTIDEAAIATLRHLAQQLLEARFAPAAPAPAPGTRNDGLRGLLERSLANLTADDWRSRANAATKIAALGARDARPRIEPLLSDPRPEVVEAAERALDRLDRAAT